MAEPAEPIHLTEKLKEALSANPPKGGGPGGAAATNREPSDDADIIMAVLRRLRAVREWQYLNPQVVRAEKTRADLKERIQSIDPDTWVFEELDSSFRSVTSKLKSLRKELMAAEATIRDTEWLMVILRRPEEL